jgi:hypothetical protein
MENIMKMIVIGMLLSLSTYAYTTNTCTDASHRPDLSVTYTTTNLIASSGGLKTAHAFPMQKATSKTFQNLTVKYFPYTYTHQHSVLAVYTSVSATGKETPHFAIYSNPPVNTIDILDRKLQGLVSVNANGQMVFSQKVTDQLAYEGLYVLRQCK